MTSAMKIRAMPTIGVVSRLVRRRASDSCSVASAVRSVAHLAARVRATGAPFGGAQGGGGGDLFQLLEAEIDARVLRASVRLAPRGRGLAHPASHLDEQPAVAGARRLLERSLVAAVAGQQHRDDVEVGRQLVAQIGTHGGWPARRRDVDDQGAERSPHSTAATTGTNQLRPIDARPLQRGHDAGPGASSPATTAEHRRATCCSGDRPTSRSCDRSGAAWDGGGRSATADRTATALRRVPMRTGSARPTTRTTEVAQRARQRRRRLCIQPVTAQQSPPTHSSDEQRSAVRLSSSDDHLARRPNCAPALVRKRPGRGNAARRWTRRISAA